METKDERTIYNRLMWMSRREKKGTHICSTRNYERQLESRNFTLRHEMTFSHEDEKAFGKARHGLVRMY